MRNKIDRSNIVSFICVIFFSISLEISEMTQPQKVIGFLDILGKWDLSLAFEMIVAVYSYLILHLCMQRKFPTPQLRGSFLLPKKWSWQVTYNWSSVIWLSPGGLGGYCSWHVINFSCQWELKCHDVCSFNGGKYVSVW